MNRNNIFFVSMIALLTFTVFNQSSYAEVYYSDKQGFPFVYYPENDTVVEIITSYNPVANHSSEIEVTSDGLISLST